MFRCGRGAWLEVGRGHLCSLSFERHRACETTLLPRTRVAMLAAIAAMSEQPVFYASGEATALRAELRKAGRKKNLTALNIAQKYVRKVSTDAEGSAKIVLWDLSRLRGADWVVPGWEREGKGQMGRFTDSVPPVVVPFRAILAQLPEADFEAVFGDGSPETGVRGLAIAAIGKTGVWWAGKVADYELVVVTSTKIVQMKARFEGSVKVTTAEIPTGTALAGSLEPAGEPALVKREAWRAWHSASPADAFLYGGWDDQWHRDLDLQRSQPGGDDEFVDKLEAGTPAPTPVAIAPPPPPPMAQSGFTPAIGGLPPAIAQGPGYAPGGQPAGGSAPWDAASPGSWWGATGSWWGATGSWYSS